MFAVFGLGPQEIVLLALAGVLLFGRKLPETARYLGRSFIEFRNGWKGMEDDLTSTAVIRREPPPERPRLPQRVAPAAPKFEAAP